MTAVFLNALVETAAERAGLRATLTEAPAGGWHLVFHDDVVDLSYGCRIDRRDLVGDRRRAIENVLALVHAARNDIDAAAVAGAVP